MSKKKSCAVDVDRASLSAALVDRGDHLVLSLTARPGAKQEALQTGPTGLVFKIAAPATEGKANARLIELLASLLGVGKSRITLLRGATGRDKAFRVEGIGHKEALDRLTLSD